MLEIRRKTQQRAEDVQKRPKTDFKPFCAQGMGIAPSKAQTALKSGYSPFTGIDARRDYRAMYRAACDFHERHNPPCLDDEMEYWTQAADDMSEVAARFDNDAFLIGLLIAVYNELEREYKRLAELAIKTV